jgi:hypothetical protein
MQEMIKYKQILKATGFSVLIISAIIILSVAETQTALGQTSSPTPTPAPARLSNGYVAPTTGTTSTTFIFYVTYYDPSNANASSPTVFIDNMPFTMRVYTGTSSNGMFSYSTTLSAGTHTYYFIFTSGSSGQPVSLGQFSGPTVTGPSPTPTPTATPKPSASPTPIPTPTPPVSTPTPSPTPTATSSPTQPSTPTITPTPQPTSTQPPAATTIPQPANPLSTPAPAASPLPTTSPIPDSTRKGYQPIQPQVPIPTQTATNNSTATSESNLYPLAAVVAAVIIGISLFAALKIKKKQNSTGSVDDFIF